MKPVADKSLKVISSEYATNAQFNVLTSSEIFITDFLFRQKDTR